MAVDVTADINGYRKPRYMSRICINFHSQRGGCSAQPARSDSGFIDFFQKFIFHFFYIRYV